MILNISGRTISSILGNIPSSSKNFSYSRFLIFSGHRLLVKNHISSYNIVNPKALSKIGLGELNQVRFRLSGFTTIIIR
jgi:hypothetical protein